MDINSSILVTGTIKLLNEKIEKSTIYTYILEQKLEQPAAYGLLLEP